MHESVEGLLVPLNEVDEGLDCSTGVFLAHYWSAHECGTRLTFLDLLDRANHVVQEILQVPYGVCNTRCLVDSRQRCVENGDDVFEQLRRDSLTISDIFLAYRSTRLENERE